jgi:hypothetical protein
VGSVAAKEQSAQTFMAARNDQGTFPMRVQPLVNAWSILNQPKPPTTGPGSDWINDIIDHLQTLGTKISTADLQTTGQDRAQMLKKYLVQAVNAMPFAQGTNDKLASAISGSPGTHMNNLTNKEVVAGLVGQERMKAAAYADFVDTMGQRYPYDTLDDHASEFADFMSRWTTTHDPRAFVMDMIAPDQQSRVFAALKKDRTAEANYRASMQVLQNHPELTVLAPTAP